MTAVDFAYHRPRSTGEAVDLLAEHGREAVLLAGGASLAILLNERAARPAHVVDLNEVSELAGIRETPAPEFHHIALDVDDFEAVYVKAKELGIVEPRAWSDVRELPDGSVQMYLRDPAGNLVEIDWPDAATLDRSIVGELPKLEDERPQTGEALQATLYHAGAARARG